MRVYLRLSHYPTKHEVTLSSEAYGQATQGRAQRCLSLLLPPPPQEINRNPRRNQTQRRQRGPRPADSRIDNKICSYGHKENWRNRITPHLIGTHQIRLAPPQQNHTQHHQGVENPQRHHRVVDQRFIRPAQKQNTCNCFTTVLKQLQVMAEKGLVRRDETARSHVYQPARPREWTQRQLAGDLLNRAFGGSAKGLLLGALSARKASKKELAELRRLLDEYRKRTP